MNLIDCSLVELRKKILNKEVSIKEVSQFYLDRSQKLNPKLNAWITLNTEILKQAETLDQKISRQEISENEKLLGLPLGIKDMFCTKGLRTTAASKMLHNFIPPYDSEVVARLKKAGALVLGKLNQDEFAMGSSNETSFFGPSYNPWKMDCVPGGSSGGSASAMAARLCSASLGTDTGGSIRQPSHFCGIVGIKPTYGRISRYGIVSFASSLDQAGPMTATVEDAALMLEVMCGKDDKDQTTSSQSVPLWSSQLNPSLKGKKIGILKEYSNDKGLSSDVQKTMDSVYDYLKKEGADLIEVSVPMTQQGVPMYYLIASSEASSNLARYDGVRYGHRSNFETLQGVQLDEFYSKTRGEGFGQEVKTRIMLGTFCLSSGYYEAYYKKASQVRRLLRDQFIQAFQSCDVIVSPVATSAAFKLGHRINNPLEMYLNDIFTVSANLAGLPAMSVPFSITQEGLPIGVQVMATHFNEQMLLDVGFAIEKGSSLKGRYAHVE